MGKLQQAIPGQFDVFRAALKLWSVMYAILHLTISPRNNQRSEISTGMLLSRGIFNKTFVEY